MQRTDQAIAGGVLVQCQQVARALSADLPALFGQHFQHIAIAHFGAYKIHPLGFERHFHGHVSHQRTHGTGHLITALQAVLHHQVHEFIAVVDAPGGIDHQQAVGIAIQCHPIVGVVGAHGQSQSFGVGSAHAVVDVQAIGLTANRNHLGPQFMEDLGGNVVGRAMGRIDHDT